MIESISLYEELLENSLPRLTKFFKDTIKHKSQFKFEPINRVCYEILYWLNNTIQKRESFFNLICPLKKLYHYCSKYFVRFGSRFIKEYDIEKGKQFEYALCDFFQSKDINSGKADKKNKHFPDNLIKNTNDEIMYYYEVKYVNAPYVTIRYNEKRIGRECYEASTVLDVGKKIDAQRNIVENLNNSTLYVYWLDYPYIKGIFFWEAEEVYRYIDTNELIYRNLGDGDVKNGELRSIIAKQHLPLLEMKPFSALYYLFRDEKETADVIIERRKSGQK